MIGGICCLNEGEDSTETAVSEYVWMKSEMRRIQAPGYPYNYRDTVGLTVSTDNLLARCFTEGSKVTINFWAQKKADSASVTLNPAVLGLSGSSKTFPVSLERGKTGYIVYDTASGKILNSSLEPDGDATQPDTSSDAPEPDTSSGQPGSSAAPDAPDSGDTSSSALPDGSDGTLVPADGKHTKTGGVNWIVLASVIGGVVLLVGAFLFVLLTETPAGLYRVISRPFHRTASPDENGTKDKPEE